MKFVYQIGQVPLYGTLVNKVSLDEGRTWIVKDTPFQQQSGWFDHIPLGRRLIQRMPVSIKGTLINDFLHIASRLKAIGGGRDIPLIVFEKQHGQIVRWLYTMGTVEDIDDASEYGEDFDGDYIKEISIKMQIDPVWSPLLRWYWENRPNYTRIQDPSTQYGTDTLFAQPGKFAEVPLKNYYQKWADTNSRYSPIAWPYLYQQDKGYGTDYAPFTSFYIHSAPEMWAAPPKAFYAFTRLLGQGTLKIIIENTVVSQVSSINLATLNTQLLNRGLVGLYSTDELFVGLTDPFCCWIKRNGAAIANFVPQWDFPGGYPGELMTGLNKITVTGSNTSGQFAANIQYGTL